MMDARVMGTCGVSSRAHGGHKLSVARFCCDAHGECNGIARLAKGAEAPCASASPFNPAPKCQPGRRGPPGSFPPPPTKQRAPPPEPHQWQPHKTRPPPSKKSAPVPSAQRPSGQHTPAPWRPGGRAWASPCPRRPRAWRPAPPAPASRPAWASRRPPPWPASRPSGCACRQPASRRGLPRPACFFRGGRGQGGDVYFSGGAG